MGYTDNQLNSKTTQQPETFALSEKGAFLDGMYCVTLSSWWYRSLPQFLIITLEK